jgi:hypothetical protein
MTYDNLKAELQNVPVLNNEMQEQAYYFLYDIMRWTSEDLITNTMKDLIVNCFAIISIPEFNKRDYNTIKSELGKAGWKINK